LAQHPAIRNFGVVSQPEAQRLATQCDFILCLYKADNQNNINASPNKIWDAIHCETPVVINKEIKVSEVVKELEIGLVIEYFDFDVDKLYDQLVSNRGTFQFDNKLKKKYSWENIESKLIKAHRY